LTLVDGISFRWFAKNSVLTGDLSGFYLIDSILADLTLLPFWLDLKLDWIIWSVW
jgi:hypothetical protein